jgi:hypothetical protein
MPKSTPIFGALNATVITKLRLIRGRHCIVLNDGLWKERAKIKTKDIDLSTDYKPFKDEAQTALVKYPVRTAL